MLADVYMYLALCFRYPDDEVYKALAEQAEPFKFISDNYLDDASVIKEQVEMETEFVRLFVTDKNANIIVPYLSCYTDDRNLLCGEDLELLRAMMLNSGICVPQDATELEDNISIVLELAATLLNICADNTDDAVRLNEALGALFVVKDKFLSVITEEIADKIIEKADVDFYKNSAVFLKGFINDFDQLMEEIILENKN